MSIALVTLETTKYELSAITFGASINNFKSDQILMFSNKEILPGIDYVPIVPLDGLFAYSNFILKDLLPYINTTHLIIVQSDAMIVNADSWSDEFLNYDYIGAPWPMTPGLDVGNGGFSLRSRKLLAALQDPRIQLHPDDYNDWAEDAVICRKYRSLLETDYGIKFAPRHIAERFSYESGPKIAKPFGVHKLHNVAEYATTDVANIIYQFMS